MSYCRFSTDDFNYDVYVYQSERGYVVHIAENRYVFDRSLLPKVTLKSTQEEHYERNKLLSQLVANSERVKIGLEYDGQTFTFGDLDQLYYFLIKLYMKGYNIPNSCFDNIEFEFNCVEGGLYDR